VGLPKLRDSAHNSAALSMASVFSGRKIKRLRN
jgi:hypothetical protein